MATKKKPTPKKKPAKTVAVKATGLASQDTPHVRALALLFATLCLAFLLMAYWRYAV